jgi:hypothetical protein
MMRNSRGGRPEVPLPLAELAEARRRGASWATLAHKMGSRGIEVTDGTIRRRLLAVDPSLVSVRVKTEPSM